MPLDHQVDERRNLLVSRASGELDGAALVAFVEGVRKAESRLRPGYCSLVDLTEADVCRVDAGAVRRAAEAANRFAEASGPVRVALVAPSDVVYGLARMYGTLVESAQREVRVFRRATEACAWLGIPDAGY